MVAAEAGGRLDAFRNPGFPSYSAALVSTGFAVQIQTVAVGWQVYDLTGDPLDLGLVGLSQFLPAILLVVVTGAVADRYPRRAIMAVCLSAMSLVALGLMLMTSRGDPPVGLVFGLLALFGASRAFYNPARQSILPILVAPKQLPGAIAVQSSLNQFATICGPVAGGFLYAASPLAAYGASFALFAVAAASIARIPPLPQNIVKVRVTTEALSAGLRYIWGNKVVLGAVSLDLFAVLLGGAIALLPIYASDILDVGPTGLGVLRAAPAVGAILMAFWLIARPIGDHAGRTMFIAIAAFGLFTIVFALSETLWISVVALALVGASDMVSMNVRATLIQLWTPDELRGRVNAVNQVFIGASNELGAFRAGASAALIGPVGAALVGGVGTLAVAAIWWRSFRELALIRGLGRP